MRWIRLAVAVAVVAGLTVGCARGPREVPDSLSGQARVLGEAIVDYRDDHGHFPSAVDDFAGRTLAPKELRVTLRPDTMLGSYRVVRDRWFVFMLTRGGESVLFDSRYPNEA